MGLKGDPRIVLVDDHTVDAPPASHMLIVRNSDTPGMIGTVGSILGAAAVNIADMHVGQSPSGESALMVLATSQSVPAEVQDQLRAADGVQSVAAVDLG